MDVPLRLLLIAFLLAANGFFVAAEFALVTVRKTRIEALAARGNRSARAILSALDDPNRFISACQLGITMASLALGWVGEEAVADLLTAPLSVIVPTQFVGLSSHALAVPFAFAVITFLHISLGEQLPKMIALQLGEATALVTVGPTNLVGLVFRPFIALLYGFINILLRLMGLRWEAEHHQAYSAEDLKALIRSSRRGPARVDDAESMAERALGLSTLNARQLMVPRTEMIAISVDTPNGRLAELMRGHGHSRYPVYEGSPDNIIGVASAKRVLALLAGRSSDEPALDLRQHLSLPLFVPEAMPAHHVLGQLKQHQTHFAIVVDEYGATAGILGIRDLLDRIVGELRDESESAPLDIELLPDGSAMVDGLALLTDVEEQMRISINDPDYDTLGGYLFGRLGRRPLVGDAVEAADRHFLVEELDGLRIARVRISAAGDSGEQPTRTSSSGPPQGGPEGPAGLLWLGGAADRISDPYALEFIGQANAMALIVSALGG